MQNRLLNFKTLLIVLIIFFGLVAFSAFIYVVFDKAYYAPGGSINVELAAKFGNLFSGFVGTLFSILSVLLIIYTIQNQSINDKKERAIDRFFKMLDYHNTNVSSLSIAHIEVNKDYTSDGRRAFVIFKIQLKRLLSSVIEINSNRSLKLKDEEVIDIAYIIFYYGLDKTWVPFIEEKLKRYKKHKIIIEDLLEKIVTQPDVKIGRTNQTNLSSYFRNMYNAIKLLDENKHLSDVEKYDLINIYRAQLSNPELYVLFYNLTSRFGKKWKDNNFIMKYEILKNMPHGYGDVFEPKQFFPMKYDDDEY